MKVFCWNSIYVCCFFYVIMFREILDDSGDGKGNGIV